MKPLTVLVTGATGFIGQALVERLVSQGSLVRATARGQARISSAPNLEWVMIGDLASGINWLPLLHDVDTVVHLAGIAHRNGPSQRDYDQVIRTATAELVLACKRAAVRRLIYMSSIGAQTGSAAESILTETDEPRPVTAYDRAKLNAEEHVRNSEVAYTILRPVLVYGPGVKGNMATLARLATTPLPLPFGSFRNRRSILARDNLIDAVCFCMQNAITSKQTYVVADSEALTISEMLRVMRDAAGRRARLLKISPQLLGSIAEALGFENLWDRIGRELVVNPSKLIDAGWRPRVDTPSGLRSMMSGFLRESR